MKKILAVLTLGLGIAAAGAATAAETIQVKGSDTIVHLSSAWAEKFMQKNPNIEIAVTGGGSGTGIAALINGSADIANASRPIKASEIAAAKGKGFEPVENVVGRDAIAVIVNPSNPVKVLTMEQVKQIFTGQVGNWKAFGGPDAKIVVYTRDSSSGTFAFFQEHVLLKKDYSVRARRLASNSAIVQSVSEDMNSVGYVGLGYVAETQGKIRPLEIKKDVSTLAVAPTVATVMNDTYPISRGLLMYTKGKPAGVVKTFMDYIWSPEGQQVVEEMGFVKK